MKDFYKAREQLEKEAIEFLRNGLYAEHPDDCPRYVHFGISAYDKKHWPEEYQKGILCFRTLFQTGEDRYLLALWNMIVNYETSESKFCKEDFTENEYTFIKAALKAVREPTEANVNPPIGTERLVLRAIEREDLKILADRFKNEGDFACFAGFKPTNKNIREFIVSFSLRRYACFAIERRSDRKLLGYIGLSIKEKTATGLLEYYLFKEERRKGYCKEAVGALAKITLNGKLYEPRETVRLGVYGKKVIRLNAIRARISSANTASQRTVERCGFAHEATIHQTLNKGPAGWTDEEIYYLTSAMIGEN